MPYLADPAPPARRTTLENTAAARARERLQARLNELAELAIPLALLDRETARLALVGLTVDPEAINLARERIGGSDKLRPVLRLYTGGPFADPRRAQRWVEALAGLGFAWVSQDDAPPFPTVLLRKGLLHVRVDLPRPVAVQTPAKAA